MLPPENTIVIGTAGHIDHGKSTLIRAITGTDPDRLPEEKARGMTIDLGFAFWGPDIAFIDVPGHEKFIKNMVAGAYGIDAVMLVIAADDGVMPQTREHYEIINLLGIKQGIVVITKSDLVDNSWLNLVIEDVTKFIQKGVLKDAPILVVDSITNKGIDQLKSEIRNLVVKKVATPDEYPFHLPIDRVFVKQGFGTIVTGTIVSGTVKIGDVLEVMPIGKRVRVRGIQTQMTEVVTAHRSMRAAINLTGIESSEIERGYRLCELGVWKPTKVFDVVVTTLGNFVIKNRSRVRLNIGTSELIGRLTFLEKNEKLNQVIARFHSEVETTVTYRERFIIRSYSPMQTIGGGMVLIPNPNNDLQTTKTISSELAKENHLNEILIYLKQNRHKSITVQEFQILLSLNSKLIEKNLSLISEEVARVDHHLLLKESLEYWKLFIIEEIKKFHRSNPDRLGVQVSRLGNQIIPQIGKSFFEMILDDLEKENKITQRNSILFLPTHSIHLSEADEKIVKILKEVLRKKGFNPNAISVIAKEINVHEKELQRIVDLLREYGEIILLEGKILLLKELFEQAQKMILEYLEKNEFITIANTVDLLKTSRKVAVAILETLDKLNLTRRVEDKRILIKK